MMQIHDINVSDAEKDKLEVYGWDTLAQAEYQPEYQDEPIAQSLTQLHREDGSGQREVLWVPPSDGNVSRQDVMFTPLSVEIINMTAQAFTFASENGLVFTVPAGGMVSIPLRGGQRFAGQTAAADTTGKSLYCIFYSYRRAIAGASSASGGGGGAVTIANGADVVEGTTTDGIYAGATPTTVVSVLRGIWSKLGAIVLAAGTAVIGKVGVVDSTGVNNLAVDASGRVSVLAITNALPVGANSIGLVTAQGSIGTLAQDAASIVLTDERGAPNGAVGQVTATTTSGTLVAARATRKSVSLVNTSTTIPVFFNYTSPATTGSMELLPQASIPLNTTLAITIITASGTALVSFAEEYT